MPVLLILCLLVGVSSSLQALVFAQFKPIRLRTRWTVIATVVSILCMAGAWLITSYLSVACAPHH